MKNAISMTTRVSAAAGALAMTATILATAAPAQAATREGGGIAWPAPTCELAVRNSTGATMSVLVESDIHEHPGMVLRDHQEPLVEYTGAYTRAKLLGRVADMPDDSGSVDVLAGAVGSFAIPCRAGETPSPTTALAVDEQGNWIRLYSNVHWAGHRHTQEGHRLLTVE